jgi:hypothetical protein
MSYRVASDGVWWRRVVIVTLVATICILVTAGAAQSVTPGQLRWTRTVGIIPGSTTDEKTAAGPSGTVAIAATENREAGKRILIARYSATGKQLWLAHSAEEAGAVDIACDKSGNVYVAGTLDPDGMGLARDWLLLKYSASGALVWSRTCVDGVWAGGVAVDKSGNVVIAGTAATAGGRPVGVGAIKYNAAGDQVWASTAIWAPPLTPAPDSHYVRAIALDPSGNVYLTSELRVAGGDEAVTVKIGAGGAVRWGSIYQPRYGTEAYGWGIAASATRAVVCGGTEGAEDDSFIVSYRTDTGAEAAWYESAQGDGKGVFLANVALDGAGNVYVAGDQWQLPSGWAHAYILKLEPSLAVTWAKSYTQGNRAWARDIRRDADGNLYIAAGFSSDSEGNDFLTMKYTSSGVRKWVKAWGGATHGDDAAREMALGTDGSVFVCGYTTTTDAWQLALLKYQR